MILPVSSMQVRCLLSSCRKEVPSLQRLSRRGVWQGLAGGRRGAKGVRGLPLPPSLLAYIHDLETI